MNSELEDYIARHIDAEPPLLHDVYRSTYLNHLYPRMCSGHVQGRLLKMLTAMIKPRRVLELGTFTGYSTLSIAEGLEPGSVIDTIEIDDEKEDELNETFGRSPYAGRIQVHIGDALDVMPTLRGTTYDMVFIDANKRRYNDYLDIILDVELVKPGGFILADNTLWDMKVVDTPADEIHDEQTRGIAAFNDRVASDPRLEKFILPVRDGLTIIRVVG
ncbi:MAG: O-methyltransferase [Muribaculaceae bacterium]|nr:O-methyltransferase [Muribaculaceae bacterium]